MNSTGRRVTLRPTVFGVGVLVLIVLAWIAQPAVADPSVGGLVLAAVGGVLAVGLIWPVLLVRFVRIEITAAPTDVVVGELASMELRASGLAGSLSVSLADSSVVAVDLRSGTVVAVPFVLPRRGVHRSVQIEVGSDSPFGILWALRRVRVDLPRPMYVGPGTQPAAFKLDEIAGIDELASAHANTSAGETVRAVRPYVTGDPAHLVHWPSTARQGSLVVREFEPPSRPALAVVLDLGPDVGSDAPARGRRARRDRERAAAQMAQRHETLARQAAGVVSDALSRRARVVLCTAEEHGGVAVEINDDVEAQRRLAAALPGVAGVAPAGWQVVRLAATDPADTSDRAGAGSPLNGVAAGRQDHTSSGVAGKAGRKRQSEDRDGVAGQRLWMLAVLAAAQLWAALGSLSINPERADRLGEVVVMAAVFCGVLAVFGLRSVPLRRVVRSLTMLSGLLLARFGELGALDGVTGSWKVMLWVAASGAALALAPSSRTIVVSTPKAVLNPGEIPPVKPPNRLHGPSYLTAGRPWTSVWTGRQGRRLPAPAKNTRHRLAGRGAPLTMVVSALLLTSAVSLIVGPYLGDRFPAGSSAADLVDRSQNRAENIMAARDNLDMATRPSLTDKVVMSVRSPLAMFWRTETFDRWDGRQWTRSRGAAGTWIGPDGQVEAQPDDLAATRGVLSEQQFRLETGFATALPSGASPVEIDSVEQLAVRPDGTIVAPLRPMGKGSSYTVESRQIPLDVAMLAGAGSARDPQLSGDLTAQGVLRQYARRPVVTSRVAQLAKDLTKKSRTDLERVSALEHWLGANTTYSIDAPIAPAGTDPVDDFLFESRVGWCEQIASSLVLMARSVGVPARLVTGFVPGEWDQVGNRFVVRERDAHAWAEIWFPDLGWVPFDPTSDVPFAGTPEARAGAGASDWRERVGVALLVAGLLVVAAAPTARLVRRISARLKRIWSERRWLRPGRQATPEYRLEQIGESLGRPRRADETLTKYSSQLAGLAGDADLAAVGSTLDAAMYAPSGSDAGRAVSLAAPHGDTAVGAASHQAGSHPVGSDIESVLSRHESNR